MSGATQNIDGSKKEWKHGKTIVNGEVRFTSVSALELADSCLRRYWYRYKMGLKDPPSDAMERGNKGHAEIATYLTTGERGHLGSLVLGGMNQLPTPGPDLMVEHDLVPDLPDGTSGLAFARLRVAGIPVLGALDLGHARRENYGVQDPSQACDEPGVLKLIDHKFPGEMKNAKAATDLPETFQMAGYGIWAFETFPGLERVRLTHNYFPVKGTPRAPTILVDRDALEPTWKRAHSVGVSIRDAARESNPDLVDANTRACHSYGKPCPAIHLCRATRQSGLASLIGVTAANRILGPSLPIVHGAQLDMTAPITPNSLMAALNAAKTGNTAPAATTPAPVAAPVTAPVATSASADVEAEIARLAAIEAAANAPAPAPVTVANPVLALCSEIEAHGFGFPQLVGNAAIAVAAARGYQLQSAGLAGSGELNKYVVAELDQLAQVLVGVQQIAAKRAAEAEASGASSTPPMSDTPPTDETAEKPKKSKKKKAKAAKQDETSVDLGTGSGPEMNDVPPDGRESSPDVGSESTTTVPAVATDDVFAGQPVTTPVAEFRVDTPSTTATATTTAAETTVVNNVTIIQQPPSAGPTLQPPGAINVYVDCVVDGLATKSLWPLVEYICANMSEYSARESRQVDEQGNLTITDFRCGDPQGKMGFGKWRGFMAACLRDAPSRGLLGPGNWHLDGAMGEIGGVVAETMRQICRATGGVYVKGAR